MKTILFQGDSITDAGRGNEFSRGSGYPTMVAGELGLRYPGEYRFFNRGTSGNRLPELYARLETDIIALKPDYLTLLIGVNDAWNCYDWHTTLDTDRFETLYGMLIDTVRESLPEVKIFLLEPFLLRGGVTFPDDRWPFFSTEVPRVAASVRRVAERFELPFVPLQEKFDEAARTAPDEYWLLDGVHPDAPGHALIARELCAAFEQYK